MQKRHEFVHESEFRLGAGFPAEAERGHQVAQLLAIENHALEDAVHKGLHGGGCDAVALRQIGKFFGLFLGFEALVAVADGGLRQAFATFNVAMYAPMSSRSSMNLASDWMRPTSCSRLIFCLPGVCCEKRAMRPMM